MQVTIHVPATLRAYLRRSEAAVVVSASSIRTALDELGREYPELHRSVCDETGALRPHIHLFVNSTLVRDDLDRSLGQGDDVYIMPAVSGG